MVSTLVSQTQIKFYLGSKTIEYEYSRNCAQYTGELSSNERANGEGILTGQFGQYKGSFLNDRMNGVGLQTLPDSNGWIRGEFRFNKPYGKITRYTR